MLALKDFIYRIQMSVRPFLLVTICVTFVRLPLLAQPNWQVNPNEFEYSMSVIGTAWLDGMELNTTEARIGAFLDGICVGVATPSLHEQTGRFIFYMVVFGNPEHINQSISFELYRSGTPSLVQDELLNFKVDATIGSVQQPFLIVEPGLEESSEILSFSLGPSTLDVVIGDNSVDVVMATTASVANLPVTFELSEKAIIWVDSQQWSSGETVLDYVSPMVLQVYSEGLFNVTEYVLTVEKEEDQIIANNLVSPNDDGFNDVWQIGNPQRYTGYTFKVMSEAGEVVFNQIGYDTPWSGIHNGELLPVGTYWYVISNQATNEEFRGFITLIY